MVSLQQCSESLPSQASGSLVVLIQNFKLDFIKSMIYIVGIALLLIESSNKVNV